MFFHLDVEIEVGEGKGGVQELLVQRDVPEFVGGLEVGKESVYGSWVAEESAKGVAFFKSRGKGVARRKKGDEAKETKAATSR